MRNLSLIHILLGWCLRNRLITVGLVLAVFASSLLLIPYIGGEFMPHLDEGALWVRATTPYTISFEEASKLSPQIRDILRSFPQVTTVANELGRPDDGTDPTGFFNNEFFVDLKPYSDPVWSGEIHGKPQLVEAIQKKLAAFPGVIFNFTQPAEDAVDEAETGLKSALAVKIFGSDLNLLAEKAALVKDVLLKTPGITEITVVKETGQPSLTIVPDRAKLARYGLNVSDINTLIGTAMGGQAATQVIQGERQFDMIVRMQEPYRSDENAIRNLLIATPDGQYLPLGQFCDIKVDSGASFIYRESNSRYIGVQFSVEGRDLAGAVGDARKRVEDAIKLPIGYKFDWGGEYKEYLASQAQMKIILPLTVMLILTILFALYGNFKFPLIIFLSVLVTEPVGGLLALRLTHTNFSVSSMLGFVALMGVAVQTSVILYSFINKLRLEGKDIATATLEASVLRLRPIMMTALVACFGPVSYTHLDVYKRQIVDGSVVMVENIFRELAERANQEYDLLAVIRSAAKDVERPIFYAIAVIIAGYLPIYVLTGPSGRLFQPMADTMSFALLGALLCALTVLPVLCAYFLRKHVHEPEVRFYVRIRSGYGRMRCV